jgi:hypothetical protein
MVNGKNVSPGLWSIFEEKNSIKEKSRSVTKRQVTHPVSTYVFSILSFKIIKDIQVSLAIRGSYAPEKSQTANTKIRIFCQIYAEIISLSLLFAVFTSVNNQNRE